MGEARAARPPWRVDHARSGRRENVRPASDPPPGVPRRRRPVPRSSYRCGRTVRSGFSGLMSVGSLGCIGADFDPIANHRDPMFDNAPCTARHRGLARRRRDKSTARNSSQATAVRAACGSRRGDRRVASGLGPTGPVWAGYSPNFEPFLLICRTHCPNYEIRLLFI
jgi:hypothetical protein